MGKLIYDVNSSFDIDDRLLAHFRIVAMNKLRLPLMPQIVSQPNTPSRALRVTP